MPGIRTTTLIKTRDKMVALDKQGGSIRGNADVAYAREIVGCPPGSKRTPKTLVHDLNAIIAKRGADLKVAIAKAPKAVQAQPQRMDHPVVNRLRECVNNGDQLVVLTRSEVRSLFGK